MLLFYFGQVKDVYNRIAAHTVVCCIQKTVLLLTHKLIFTFIEVFIIGNFKRAPVNFYRDSFLIDKK